MQNSSKLKILVLHGHAMSGELMKQKLGAIRSETKKLADWYFPDGPIALPQGTKVPGSEPQASPEEGGAAARAPTSQETASAEAPSSPSPRSPPPFIPRSWYDFSRIEALMDTDPAEFDRLRTLPWSERRPLYDGMEAALQTVSDFAEKEGPFDGIFAFSQGAVVAAVVLAQLRLGALAGSTPKEGSAADTATLSEALHRVATQLPPVSPKLQGVRFCILVSGLLPKDPFYSELVTCPALAVDTPLPVHSLHCWGRTDNIITPAMSRQLNDAAVFGPSTLTAAQQLELSAQIVAGPSKREGTLLPQGGTRFLVTHEGGHVVASLLRKAIKEFLSKMVVGSSSSSPPSKK